MRPSCAVTRTELVEPTLGRGVLAILFLMAIPGDDESQFQGQHPGLPGATITGVAT